jgi:hypothetical protein
MIVMSRIGQSIVAAVAAIMLTATVVSAASGPVQAGPAVGPAAPAALVVALLSSQAGA